MSTHRLEKFETSSPEKIVPETRWVVVINHHEARIFKSEVPGTTPGQILPHDPNDFFRHAPHSKDFARGKEKPDENSFFEPIAHALKDASQILTFGSGTGTANETDRFVTWLKIHHHELAKRIVGSLIIDAHHTTDAQLLSKARDFYALPRVSAATAT